jgi:hypothetical protein
MLACHPIQPVDERTESVPPPLERYIIDSLSNLNFIICDGSAPRFPILFASEGFKQGFHHDSVGHNCGDCVGPASMTPAILDDLAKRTGLTLECIEDGLAEQTAHLNALVRRVADAAAWRTHEDADVSALVVNHLVSGVQVVQLTMHSFPARDKCIPLLVGTQICRDDLDVRTTIESYLTGEIPELGDSRLTQVVQFIRRDGVPHLVARLSQSPLNSSSRPSIPSPSSSRKSNRVSPTVSPSLRSMRSRLTLLRVPSKLSCVTEDAKSSSAHLTVSAEMERRGYTIHQNSRAGGFSDAEILIALKETDTAVVKSSSDTETISRLANEYSILRGLVHDAVVRAEEWIEILDEGQRVNAGYMMRRCNGETLRKRLREPRPEGLAMQHAILTCTISAVAYLHNQSISHRDLHSGNIMVDDAGLAVLLDFGNAHRFGEGSKDIKADLPGRDMDCARTFSSLSQGAGTVTDILPPREGLGSGRERDCFAIGLLGVGVVRWTEIATEDIYCRDEMQAPRLKASYLGLRPVGPTLTAVLHGLLQVVPGRRWTAQSALDGLPAADAWFAP